MNSSKQNHKNEEMKETNKTLLLDFHGILQVIHDTYIYIGRTSSFGEVIQLIIQIVHEDINT